MLRLILRTAMAILMCFVITFFITNLGAYLGRSIGLDDGHNLGEVVLAFIAGGIIMLIYSRRFDDPPKKEGRP